MKTKQFILACILIAMCNPLDVFPVYRRAPGISLRNKNGNYVTLTDLNKNKNIVLSYWASYCVPCKAEMPKLIDLEKKYSAAKNLQLLFVSIANESEQNSAIDMLSQMGSNNECLFDIYQLSAKKYIPDLKIPAVFFINRYGYIVFEARCGKNECIADLENAIQSLK